METLAVESEEKKEAVKQSQNSIDADEVERLVEVHKDKSTDELKTILLKADDEEWEIEALVAMNQILEARGIHLGRGIRKKS